MWQKLAKIDQFSYFFGYFHQPTTTMRFIWSCDIVESLERLGSVAGPVIQATGRSEFEDGLGSGDFVSGYSYHMSVRTRLSDHTKQTKFQSQRPNDVETPVPSISSTEVQQHLYSQYYLVGWPPWVISPFKVKNADCSCWPPAVSTSWGNDIHQRPTDLKSLI
jgi:hypothetical protein